MAKLLVRDLMTKDAFSVRRDVSLSAVRDLMDDKNIRHVPVVDEEGQVVGLVSQRDRLRSASAPVTDMPLTTQSEIMHQVKVADMMTRDVETVDADPPIAIAAQIMLENKYGCLPVVEENRLIGILTEADFVRHLAETDDDRVRVEPKVQERRRQMAVHG
jgi:CBS domain-containing protein